MDRVCIDVVNEILPHSSGKFGLTHGMKQKGRIGSCRCELGAKNWGNISWRIIIIAIGYCLEVGGEPRWWRTRLVKALQP